MQRFCDIGSTMAEQALALAKDNLEVAPMREVPARPVFDWRHMQRFGINRRELPADVVAALGASRPSL